MQTQLSKMDRYLEYMGIFSVMLLSTALAACPSKCTCSSRTVRCREKSLLDIPNFETLDNDPYIIDLSSNDIDFITHYSLSFDKAELVEILYLNDSKIIDIDDTAFKELINMKEIYLSQNLLSDLPANSFKFNENLILLDLSYNLFRNMPRIISRNLRILNLMSSGIENIPLDRFASLPNLQHLYLQRNNIRTLDLEMFKYLPKLISIELEYNAWKCSCESVRLFNYLNANNLTQIIEPIQCRSENDFFITIFDENGVVAPILDICKESENLSYNFGGELDQETTTLRRKYKNSNKKKLTKKQNIKPVFNTTCEHIEYVTPLSLTNYLIFSISILIAFITGLIMGNLFSTKKITNGNDNSSFKSLLKKDGII